MLQAICELDGAGPQGDTGWCSPSHRPLQIKNWLLRGEESSPQERWHPLVDCPRVDPNKGAIAAVPPSFGQVPQLNLFPYVSCTSRAADPPPEPRVSVYKQVSLCACPLKGHLGFQFYFCLPRWPEFPLVFTVRFCGNSSFLDWNSGLGNPCVGVGPLIPSGPSAAMLFLPMLSLLLLNCIVLVGVQSVSCLCSSYQIWVFLYILRCML